MSPSKGKRCITTEGGFKRAATMKKRNASPKRGKKNATAKKKRDVSEEESDYIPFEVIRDHNIELPANVILRDEKGKNWNTYVKTWSDGRTWLSGEWRNLCRRNLVQENDRCICEFMPSNSLGKELVIQVTIIRRKDLEAQPN
nr:B3 domain-containing protein At5g57720-like isoform X1 [Ipomoea batatas]